MSQEGDFEIEYVIQNGGDDEKVLRILHDWRQRVDTGAFKGRCRKIQLRYYVEKDAGMYDAISRGFSRTDGSTLAWLNSDDLYHPNAFQAVADIFSQFEKIEWLTGLPCLYNEKGSIIYIDRSMPSFSREFVRRGYYNRRFLDFGFSWIQQESTFWRRSLWDMVGAEVMGAYRYAGDYHLWKAFAEHAPLVRVHSLLGGIRKHKDQLTKQLDRYYEEIEETGRPPVGLKVLRHMVRSFPFLRGTIYRRWAGRVFLGMIGLKRDWVLGEAVQWAFRNDREWHHNKRKGIF